MNSNFAALNQEVQRQLMELEILEKNENQLADKDDTLRYLLCPFQARDIQLFSIFDALECNLVVFDSLPFNNVLFLLLDVNLCARFIKAGHRKRIQNEVELLKTRSALCSFSEGKDSSQVVSLLQTNG